MTMLPSRTRGRRLATAAATPTLTLAGGIARPYLSRAADRPRITHGLQSGDTSVSSGVVWARTDRPARLTFDLSTTDSFKSIARSVTLDALPESDFAVKALIDGLPSGQDIFYRVRSVDLSDTSVTGEPVTGRFRTAPTDRRNVSFLWSGDATKEKSTALLSARPARALHEYMPIAPTPQEATRVYRKVGYGPLLDIFFLDERTYRGPNGDNRQKEMSPETAFMGRVQLDWLK